MTTGLAHRDTRTEVRRGFIDYWFWLGCHSVLPTEPRIVGPEGIRFLRLIKPNRRIYWGVLESHEFSTKTQKVMFAHDPSSYESLPFETPLTRSLPIDQMVACSRISRSFDDNHNYIGKGWTRVQSPRILKLPDWTFQSGLSRVDSPFFEFGETIHFLGLGYVEIPYDKSINRHEAIYEQMKLTPIIYLLSDEAARTFLRQAGFEAGFGTDIIAPETSLKPGEVLEITGMEPILFTSLPPIHCSAEEK